MLTSRIQHPRAPRLSPAALEAAATRFLAEAEGKKASTVRNRDWRSVIQQGPSADTLAFLRTDQETREDNEKDLGIVAGGVFRTADDRPAPGNFARSLDRNGWNAIRVLAPVDLPDRDVLEASASKIGGQGQAKAIGKAIGLSDRMIRKIQDRHAAWAAENLDAASLVAALDAGLPEDVVVPRRSPSRRGRKPRGAQQPRPLLVLAPHTPAPSRPRRPCRPRVRRPRWVGPGQLDFF